MLLPRIFLLRNKCEKKTQNEETTPTIHIFGVFDCVCAHSTHIRSRPNAVNKHFATVIHTIGIISKRTQT